MLFIACMYVLAHRLWHTCGTRVTTCRNQFSSFTMWVLEFELRSSGLVAGIFPHRAIHLASFRPCSWILPRNERYEDRSKRPRCL